MVNTFLVNTNFRTSASLLDRHRLGKQRVEAQQILSILEKLTFLANYFSIPLVDRTSSRENRTAWIRHVVSTYKSSGIKAILVRNNLVVLYTNALPHKIKSGNRLVFDANGLAYEVQGKQNKVVFSDRWDNFVIPGDFFITTGFMNHPAVTMWIGYEDALKDYINAHIETWISRGYNNTMELHSVSEKYDRPAWTYSESVLADFQASLLHREIERREPAWYMRQEAFVASWASSPEQFCSLVQQYPDNWFDHIDASYLLSFGSERGLPWS